MILIVSYDLKTTRDYTGFFEALKQQGLWWHYLASTWLLSTDKSPEEVSHAVHPYMDSQDSLFVAEMGPRYQGYLPKQAWDWINAQINSGYFYGDVVPPGRAGTLNPHNPFFPKKG